jgi:hypothetical protein
MTAVAMKVLAFYSENFDGAAIAGDLDAEKEITTCVMHARKEVSPNMLRQLGRKSTAGTPGDGV